MSDGRIDIDTRINTQNLDKDVKSVDSKLKSLSKTGSSSLGGLVNSFASAATAAGAVVGAVALVSKGIKETTEAYRKQAKAETQLETAAKNNPYLNEASVATLKSFASELQSISTVGDEELLPMMAQLVANGRTQKEIMDITRAAVDLSASGMMDLNSAVSALNATYNGMAGTLGRQNGAIKNLTEEQLKNGEAVKIISEQYKGMAKKVADTTGSAQQLANTWGDFKEHVGSGIEKALTPARKVITGMIQDVNNAIEDLKKAKENAKKSKDIASGKGTDADYQSVYQYEKKKLDEIEDERKTVLEILEIKKQIAEKEAVYENTSRKDKEARKKLTEEIKDLEAQGYKLSDAWQIVQEGYLGTLKEEYDAQLKIVEPLEKQVNKINEKASKEQAAQKAAEDAAALGKKNRETAEAALKTYRETIATKEQELRIRKKLGEKITQEQENEEMLQTRLAAYIKLIQDAQGTITGDAERERIEREKILELTEKTNSAKKEAEAEESKKALLKDLDDALGGEKLKQSEIMAKQISDLEIEYEKLTAEKKVEINEEYTQKLKELAEKRQQMIVEEKAADERATLESVGKKIEIISSFASQYTSIMSTISDIVTQQAKNEATVKQAEVEKQYQQGIISQEEYEKRKSEIEKEAAEESYRIQMWQWAASIAQATANTAQAMVSTLAQEAGPAALKIAMAAMVAAAGGAQLATIIANKPIPPSRFATGGIVGGTSYTGDRVTAHVNSGEMILNRMQQRNLFDSINSNQLGTKPQMNVKIFNSASNEVSARPEMTEDGMRIMIRKIVSDDIGSGRMNKSLIAAQSSFGGTRYTN